MGSWASTTTADRIGSATRRRGRARHSSRGVAARRDRRRVLSGGHAGLRRLGHEGLAQNDGPNAFMNADVDAVARTLAAIMDEERASVVVTYDENGFYGHPDHIMANVVTRAALGFATSPKRLYYPVAPRAFWRRSSREPRPRASFSRPGFSTPDTPSRTTSSRRPWTYAPSPSANVKRLPRTLHKSTMPTRHNGRRTLYAVIWHRVLQRAGAVMYIRR